MNIIDEIQKSLTNYWEVFVLNIPKIAVSLLIIIAFLVVASSISSLFKKRLLHRTDNKLVASYAVRLVKFLLILVGVMLGLQTMGLTGVASGLLAGAGVGAVVIGFAFKEIGENFLAGIILVFDRPFRLGDTVTIEGNMGKVVGLNFRTTRLKTFDGKDVYVPNISVITNEVYNHTQDGFLRLDFLIGIDYDDDVDEAITLITKKVNANPNVLKNEKTLVLINDFGTNSVNLQILFWVNTIDYKVSALETKTQVMKEVKKVLLENKFGLPANIQEVKMYRPEPIPIILKREE